MRFKTRARQRYRWRRKIFSENRILMFIKSQLQIKVGRMFLSVFNLLLSENLPGSLTLLFDIFALVLSSDPILPINSTSDFEYYGKMRAVI